MQSLNGFALIYLNRERVMLTGRNCLNDFGGRLGKKLKNSLGIKALVF